MKTTSNTGIGKVLARGKEVATVAYSLGTYESYILPMVPPSTTKTVGALVVIDGERDFRHKGKLTLVLEDGRRWEFKPTRSKVRSGNYEIRITYRAD